VARVSQSNGQGLTGRITKKGPRLGRKTLVQCTLISKRLQPVTACVLRADQGTAWWGENHHLHDAQTVGDEDLTHPQNPADSPPPPKIPASHAYS